MKKWAILSGLTGNFTAGTLGIAEMLKIRRSQRNKGSWYFAKCDGLKQDPEGTVWPPGDSR